MKLKHLLIFGALFAVSCAAPAGDEIDRKVEELLAKMTLEEKIGQMNQVSGGYQFSGEIAKGNVGSILNIVDPVEINAVQRVAVEESRLGIPLLVSRDVIHGFRTIFPIPIGLAATFDPALVEQGARVAAVEATASGVRWTFSPMLDIARDPRWGRIAEGSGEDPYLDTQMGVAMVKGYQGEDFTDGGLYQALCGLWRCRGWSRLQHHDDFGACTAQHLLPRFQGVCRGWRTYAYDLV